MLFCDRPTATVVIRNLGKRGWVKREKDEHDRRQIRVILTAAGRAKLNEVECSPWNGPAQRVAPLTGFSQAEIAELNRLLRKLSDGLEQIVETTQGASDDPTE